MKRQLILSRETVRLLGARALESARGGWIHTAVGGHTCEITDLSCEHFCTQGDGCGGSETCTTGHD